jgi:hypothetical protein
LNDEIRKQEMGMACSILGDKRIAYSILMRKQRRKDHQEDADVGDRIILNWILANRMGWYGLDSSGSGQGPVEDILNSGAIKFWEILGYLSDRLLLNKDSAPVN